MNLAAIIEGCQKRKAEAEKMLFFRFAPTIYTLCRRYSRHDPEAKDLLQECFLHLFSKIHFYDPEKGPFEPWLHRVCTNTILKQLRQVKKEERLTFLAALPEPEIDESDLEQVDPEVIIQAIRQLPEGYREVLNLFVYECWSHKQIATELGITESTSRSQLSRAKQLLKQILQTLIPDIHEKRLV